MGGWRSMMSGYFFKLTLSIYIYTYTYIHGGFLKYGGSPSYHPAIRLGFSMTKTPSSDDKGLPP